MMVRAWLTPILGCHLWIVELIKVGLFTFLEVFYFLNSLITNSSSGYSRNRYAISSNLPITVSTVSTSPKIPNTATSLYLLLTLSQCLPSSTHWSPRHCAANLKSTWSPFTDFQDPMFFFLLS